MQAIVLTAYGGVENFTLAELPDPVAGPADIRVRIRAASFNPIDYQIRRGSPESTLVSSPVLGRDFAGVVDQVGADVTQWRVGDAVFGYASSMGSNGTYAQLVSVPAAIVGRVPARLSWVQAAALPVAGLTALQTWQVCGVDPTARVLVLGGAGGVGTLLVQLAPHFGVRAPQLWATAGSAASRQHLQRLGVPAAHLVDYRHADVRAALRASTGGPPFDYVFDLVGGPLAEAAAEALAIGGTFADIAFQTTPEARSSLFDRATTVHNIAIYANALDRDPARMARFGEQLAQLATLVEAGTLPPPPVSTVGTFGLTTVQEAHLRLERNQTQGKLAMEYPAG